MERPARPRLHQGSGIDRIAGEIGGLIPGMIEFDVGLETRYASDPEYRKVYAI